MHTPSINDIEAAKTPKGGFSKESLQKLGVPWPPPKGWLKRLKKRAAMPPENLQSAEHELAELKKAVHRLLNIAPYPLTVPCSNLHHCKNHLHEGPDCPAQNEYAAAWHNVGCLLEK